MQNKHWNCFFWTNLRGGGGGLSGGPKNQLFQFFFRKAPLRELLNISQKLQMLSSVTLTCHLSASKNCCLFRFSVVISVWVFFVSSLLCFGHGGCYSFGGCDWSGSGSARGPYWGKPRYKKNGKKRWNCPLSAAPPPPTGKKGTFVVWKKSVNRDKCVFATKQRMFRGLAIVEILYYRGLPIPYPTY